MYDGKLSSPENRARIHQAFANLGRFLRRPAMIGALIGTLALTNVGLKIPPENVVAIEGVEIPDCKSTPDTPNVEDISIVDANLAGNASFGKRLIDKYSPSFATFQEVGGDNAPSIVREKPCRDGIFGMASYNVNPLGGGQGNLIVAEPQRLSEVYKHTQTGLPDKSEFIDGIVHWDKYKILDSYKESRSTLIGTYAVLVDGQKVKINIANIHVASGKVGDKQLRKFIPFMESEMSSDKEINIIIGDTNRIPLVMRQMLGHTASNWLVTDIGTTSRNSDQQIDQLIYRPSFVIGDQIYRLSLKTTVLDDQGSDHKAVLAEAHTWPVVDIIDLLKEPKDKKLSPKLT